MGKKTDIMQTQPIQIVEHFHQMSPNVQNLAQFAEITVFSPLNSNINFIDPGL